jgi:uncharacterized protein YggE
MRWILITALSIALLAAPVSAQAPEAGKHQIVTTGLGRVEAEPNQAVITVGVQTQRPTAAAASTEAARVADQILSRLQQIGIRRPDIRTSGLQLSPVYSAPRDGTPAIVAYRASYTLTLTLSDLKLVGPALDESVKAGANTIAGITLGLRDASAARREALTMAVREAREKADVIARAAGLQIRGVERIVEEGVDIQVRALERAVPSPAVPTPIEPGTVSVIARVTAVFNF